MVYRRAVPPVRAARSHAARRGPPDVAPAAAGPARAGSRALDVARALAVVAMVVGPHARRAARARRARRAARRGLLEGARPHRADLPHGLRLGGHRGHPAQRRGRARHRSRAAAPRPPAPRHRLRAPLAGVGGGSARLRRPGGVGAPPRLRRAPHHRHRPPRGRARARAPPRRARPRLGVRAARRARGGARHGRPRAAPGRAARACRRRSSPWRSPRRRAAPRRSRSSRGQGTSSWARSSGSSRAAGRGRSRPSGRSLVAATCWTGVGAMPPGPPGALRLPDRGGAAPLRGALRRAGARRRGARAARPRVARRLRDPPARRVRLVHVRRPRHAVGPTLGPLAALGVAAAVLAGSFALHRALAAARRALRPGALALAMRRVRGVRAHPKAPRPTAAHASCLRRAGSSLRCSTYRRYACAARSSRARLGDGIVRRATAGGYGMRSRARRNCGWARTRSSASGGRVGRERRRRAARAARASGRRAGGRGATRSVAAAVVSSFGPGRIARADEEAGEEQRGARRGRGAVGVDGRARRRSARAAPRTRRAVQSSGFAFGENGSQKTTSAAAASRGQRLAEVARDEAPDDARRLVAAAGEELARGVAPRARRGRGARRRRRSAARASARRVRLEAHDLEARARRPGAPPRRRARRARSSRRRGRRRRGRGGGPGSASRSRSRDWAT